MASPDTFTCPHCEHSNPENQWEPVPGTEGTEAFCPACDADFPIGECDACGEGPHALVDFDDSGSFCFHCTHPDKDPK